MKNPLQLGVALLAPIAVGNVLADGENPNRLSLGGSVLVNAKTSVRHFGVAYAPGVFDDGTVLTDISGNAGGQTWNFGYQNDPATASSLNLHRTPSPREGSLRDRNDEPRPGFEFTAGRRLWTPGRGVTLGLEGASAVNFIDATDRSSVTGTVASQQSTFGVPAGVLLPLAPYQGTFAGPGPLLNASAASTQSVPASLRSDFTSRVDGFILALKAGPFAEFQLSDSTRLELGAGGALAHSDLDFTYSETFRAGSGVATPPAARAGSASRAEWFAGFYGRLLANVNLDVHSSLFLGAEYLSFDTASVAAGSKTAKLDLRNLCQLKIGFAFDF